MWVLVFGLVVFIGTHLISSFPRRRARYVRKLGDKKFKTIYSILAVIGLLSIIVGFGYARSAGWGDLYTPPSWLRHPAMLLMLLSFILFATKDLKGHIKWYARHPMIAGIKLWAFSHLLMNGDLPSVLLFGSFLAWAIIARISMAKRERVGLLKTRDFTPSTKADVLAIVISVVLVGLFVMKVHEVLIGVPIVT